MPATDRSLDGLTFLTDAARQALRRRLRELAGFALIVLALLLAIALTTWSVQDPSLSHATNAPVRNLLGITGASIADLSMQLLGLGGLALVLPIAVWGWRLASHRPLCRERIRLVIWIVAVALAAAFAATLPATASWPLPAGLGGVVGDAELRLVAMLTGVPLGGLTRFGVAAATGIAGLTAFALACGFGLHGLRRKADADRKSVV